MRPHEIGHQFASKCQKKNYPYVVFHGGKNIYLESAIPLFDILVLIDLLVANCDGWHKKSDLEMTVLCGRDKDVAWSITSILLHADEEVVEEAMKNYKTAKVAKDIFNREND